MLKVGITGGIGSGKSIVCHLFSLLGVPVYNADHAAKRLMDQKADLKNDLKNLLGDSAYGNDGCLNRIFVSSKVFKDPALLEEMNKLVHPHVLTDYVQWLSMLSDKNYSIMEAAILIESGFHKVLDEVVLVDAPEEVRIKRVVKRDGRSEEAVKAIIAQQWKTEEKIKYTSFMIKNDDKSLVLPQVLEIHKKLREKSESGIPS